MALKPTDEIVDVYGWLVISRLKIRPNSDYRANYWKDQNGLFRLAVFSLRKEAVAFCRSTPDYSHKVIKADWTVFNWPSSAGD